MKNEQRKTNLKDKEGKITNHTKRNKEKVSIESKCSSFYCHADVFFPSLVIK